MVPTITRMDPLNATILDIKSFASSYNFYSANGFWTWRTEMVMDNSSNLYCAFSTPSNPDLFDFY